MRDKKHTYSFLFFSRADFIYIMYIVKKLRKIDVAQVGKSSGTYKNVSKSVRHKRT